MTKYRDSLCEDYDNDIGSVVGCGLDRLNRQVSPYEIQVAIDFYQSHKSKINKLPIGERRQAIEEYISNDFQIPSCIDA